MPGEKTGLLAHLARRPRPRSALRVRATMSAAATVDLLGGGAVAGQPADLARPRDRRVDALLRVANMRGAGPRGCRCRYRAGLDSVWARAPRNAPSRSTRICPRDPRLSAGRAARNQTRRVVSGRERPEPRATVDSGGVADDLPLSPFSVRRRGWSSARVAAFVRHRAGRGRVDLSVMQALLGHTHVDTTARYVHLAPKR